MQNVAKKSLTFTQCPNWIKHNEDCVPSKMISSRSIRVVDRFRGYEVNYNSKQSNCPAILENGEQCQSSRRWRKINTHDHTILELERNCKRRDRNLRDAPSEAFSGYCDSTVGGGVRPVDKKDTVEAKVPQRRERSAEKELCEISYMLRNDIFVIKRDGSAVSQKFRRASSAELFLTSAELFLRNHMLLKLWYDLCILKL
ncbi:hypothetical protein LXL04_017746 [Taraxacum kok-saghyz]